MRRAIVIAAAVAAGGCPGGEHVVVRTVLSRTGAPMAGIRVQVEEQPWKTTGADGRATFDGVPGRVTVRVHQSFARDGDLAYAVDQVQVLRGRTGREIVAEVGDPGPVLFHGARVTGTVTGRFGPPSTVLYVGVAYQDWAISMPIAGDGSFDWGVPWRGGESATEATVTMRAWESDAASPPGHYYGFGSTSVHLYELRDIPTVVSLSLAPVTDGVVQGTVMVPPALPDGFVYSFLTLAFSRYESLPLASIPSTPGPFTLTVPSVP